ncbi:MAG: hypothetical protein Q7J84_18940 [Sulfuricaulis sp.]|nr:hypothetical protein [Sulfuricaulis sp.]
MSRRAARVDANQSSIVSALRKAGASVQHLHGVGQDCPDLLVGYRAQNYVIEIKTPKGKLKPGQALWFRDWRGQACVAHTAEEALKSIGAIK